MMGAGSQGAGCRRWVWLWCQCQYPAHVPLPCLQTPGPCRYCVVDTDVYKHRAPRFTMLARNMVPGDTTTTPGPGAHSPQQVSRDPRGEQWGDMGLSPHLTVCPPPQSRPQGVTFGIRHSEYLVPLIVDVPD